MRYVQRVLQWHRPLMLFSAAMAVTAVVCSVAYVVDSRALLGAPVWAKPLKFAVSFAFYAPTLAWMLHRLPASRRIGWWAGSVITAASTVEMAIIVGQAARGRQSHFNLATGLDSTLYRVMGLTISLLYCAHLAIAVVLLRGRGLDRPLMWALRGGLIVSTLGMSVGIIMVVVGAHSIGAEDGGPGLALLGWNTDSGDLRVGHFAGMHALQILPLLAVGLGAMRQRRLDVTAKLRLVVVASVAYAGVVVLLTWQALRSQALLKPDTTTGVAASVLLLAVLVSTVLVLRPRQSGPTAAALARH